MRFCKQRGKFSCGPVALLNIDKHFGKQVTYKDLPRYSKRVSCKSPDGTFTSEISKVIGRATRRSYKKAKQFIVDGNCILVQTKKYEGHYYLLVMNQHMFGVVNRHGNWPCVGHISRQQAGRILTKSYRTWYVSKRTGIR